MTAWNILWNQRDVFLSGFANTLALFILSSVLAIVGGMLTLLVLEGRITWFRRLVRGAMDVMRTLPFLIYAYLLYYGLPELGLRLDAWSAGLIALATYHGTYFAEILRGARATLSKGQMESARAHGFSTLHMVRRILLPQLFLKNGPLLGNQLIICLKDTAFLTIITVKELTGAASAIQATYFIPVEAFIVAIALYWFVSLFIESLVKKTGRLALARGLGYEQTNTARR